MAITTRSRVEGFREIEKVLKAMPAKVAKKELGKAVRAGSNILLKEARARAPRGGVPSEMSEQFGPLHKKIRVRRAKRARHSVEDVINEGTAFYGFFLEFGTKHIKAQPWLTPAFDVSATAAVVRIGERLGKAVEKITAEQARRFGSTRRRRRR